MRKNILITGGTGLLGLGLFSTKNNDHNTFFSYLNDETTANLVGEKFYKLDSTDATAVETFIKKNKIDYVIHCASLGNIDFCEKNKEIAYKVNVESTQILADLSKKYNFKLIYISSNAIFDGLHAPYNEKSEANPQNYYGFTKRESEEIVLENNKNIVVRLLLMYGWNSPHQRPNPMTWIISELTKKNKMHLVDDIYNNPISNLEAAKTIWSLIETTFCGIIHIAGKERVSRYEFAQLVAKTFNLDESLLIRVTSDYFPEITKRMPDTTYDVALAKKILRFKPKSLRDSLKYLKNHKQLWEKTH